MMSDEAKKARAAYAREWRKKNPEKDRAIKEKYWEKKAAQAAAEAAKDSTDQEGISNGD